MPYLMSAEVIAVPSSYLRPFFRVYVHSVASLLGRPVSVARSGTTLALSRAVLAVAGGEGAEDEGGDVAAA